MTSGSINVINPIPTKPTISSSLNNQFNYNSLPTSPSPSTPVKSNSNNTTFTTTTTTTSLSTSNSTTNTTSNNNYHVPSLDFLINDCFLKSINHLSINEDIEDDTDISHRLKLVELFENFINKVHCQENLHFLIEIFKYEYYYENIFPNNTDSSIIKDSNSDDYEKLRLKNTPSPSPAQFFIPPSHYKQLELSSSSTGIISSAPSQSFNSGSGFLSKTISIRSEELDPNQVFVSTIDDLDPQNLSTLNNNIWDNLKSQNIDNEEDGSDDEIEELQEDNTINDRDRQLLINQWNLILNNYVIENSPDQINISQKLHDQIIVESSKSDIHQPLILLKAKNEVYQIIKENTYLQFIKKLQQSQKARSPSPVKSQDQTLQHSPSSLTYVTSQSPEDFKQNVNEIIIPDDQSSQIQPSTATTISNPPSPAIPYMSKQTYKSMKKKLLSLTSSSSSSSPSLKEGGTKSATSSLPNSRANSPPTNISPSSSFIQHSNPITINRAHTMSVPQKHHHHHAHTTQNIISESNSTSSSSISNLLGHLKLSNPNRSSGSNSGTTTPISNLHSLTTSPVSERYVETSNNTATNAANTSSNGLKFWSSRKKTT
ncbi:hypothetical protein DFJ63DRAFT_319684 [Scheffersomyces coipomensis]|uniref:uncharacterized protein n=1 Tax=Scheffersomyces coipomensis TaxID=1788519 RepID=UPI00315D97C4